MADQRKQQHGPRCATSARGHRPQDRPTAEVLPFPSVRRQAAVEKLAARLITYKPQAAEGILAARLLRIRESLERKGVARRLITSDVAAFEGAVRAALWRRVMPGGGAA